VGATPQIYFEHGSSAVSFDWSHCGTVAQNIIYKNKRAHAVDMNHGLNLGGVEVTREMEGTKKGGQ
jgi:hypothetical protein